MKKTSLMSAASVSVLLGVSLLIAADAPATNPRIDPKADAVLKQMSGVLAASKSLTFEAYSTTEQLLASGQKVDISRTSKISLRRPNGLAATVSGDSPLSEFIYDGKTVTLVATGTNTYVQSAAPATVDETLDMLNAKHAIAFPLADLVFADPYKAMSANIRSSQYLGMSMVFDTKCHHLVFRQESVDWQIWIDAGEKAVPMKLVITYKESPGHLSYVAFFTKWNLAAEIPAATFTYTPPAGAKKLELPAATEPAK